MAEAFYRAYAARSGVTPEFLAEHGRRVYRCSCGEDGCEGWAMISEESVRFDREHGHRTRGVDLTDPGWSPLDSNTDRSQS